MNKIINPCTLDRRQVYCRIKYENGRLSISGVIGPLPNGNATGGCGQIQDTMRQALLHNTVQTIKPWTRSMIYMLLQVWDRWHLNDMRAGCEHQREMGWTYKEHSGDWVFPARPIDAETMTLIETTFPLEGIVVLGHTQYRLADGAVERWDEYAGHRCPICGYRIGSAWLREDVPPHVIEILESLPETQRQPAWV